MKKRTKNLRSHKELHNYKDAYLETKTINITIFSLSLLVGLNGLVAYCHCQLHASKMRSCFQQLVAVLRLGDVWRDLNSICLLRGAARANPSKKSTVAILKLAGIKNWKSFSFLLNRSKRSCWKEANVFVTQSEKVQMHFYGFCWLINAFHEWFFSKYWVISLENCEVNFDCVEVIKKHTSWKVN